MNGFQANETMRNEALGQGRSSIIIQAATAGRCANEIFSTIEVRTRRRW